MITPISFPKNLLPKAIFLFLLSYLSGCQKPDQESTVLNVNVVDPHLELQLMAEDPDIVTPIGIAVDEADRVYVLESHTHLPPKEYEGPNHDIIRVFEDTNGDGLWDSSKIFAEGLEEGLNIAFSPEGHLYAVTSMEVWKFYDEDGDGISERKEKLIELVKPEQVYAHAAILSITFDTEGWMYIGRGNTGGVHWVFRGKDGTEVSGYGDGGNIMRAKWDGSELEEFSTGYWNPFDLKFDNYGRLLVADNDPDSRGPNRLVHAVKGGDFGYKSLFGGSGIHPYLAWEGELPGTLPIAVPLGEAPSGLLNANLANLPEDYHDEMLCTIWEESRIVRINFKDEGLSVKGSTEIILQGDENFRPVAFATDSKGTIYFTDWVLRYYPNHGKGRIWSLKAKDSTPVLSRRKPFEAPLPHSSVKQLDEMLFTDQSFNSLKEGLHSEDPFQFHAAVRGLAQGQFSKELLSLTDHENAAVRLGALLAFRQIGHPEKESVAKRLLNDESEEVVRMTMIWIGRDGMEALLPSLLSIIATKELSTELFETYLETVKLLQPEFIQAFQTKESSSSKNLPRNLPKGFITEIIEQHSNPVSVRAMAIKYLDNPSEHKEMLIALLKSGEEPIKLEVIRSLSQVSDPGIGDLLGEMAIQPQHSTLLRAEALLALARQPFDQWQKITPLLKAQDQNISIEAARLLKNHTSKEPVKTALRETLEDGNACEDEVLRQQLLLALHREVGERPDPGQIEQWQQLLDEEGDAQRGRRVFFSNDALCSSCHAIEGRGGDLGPDLSNVGKSKDRRGLISSLLLPSQEISPEWQGWFIQMKDGTSLSGRQIDVGDNDIKLYTESDGFIDVQKEDVEDYGILESSLMPEGLEKRLTNHDLIDLLAFLESL
ncbi:PVC-type heme-binding CxxCH protein [Pleomorphovibrio marinus]|uniref:PVC-type heme-binding CxxCH protein n=1 Tax=Pleomorphovibrio marinus TaxID=2164132 RepID=UPI001E37500E|nr:PVC-type heme-binding CxxCH protein [Pleomorphovibrio marinus]